MRSLLKLENDIKKEIPYINIKPYSHNIIGLLLSQIANDYGDSQAKETIVKLGLNKRGW